MENFNLKGYLAENRLLKETKEKDYYNFLMDLGGTELAGDTFQDMMKKRNDFTSFEDFLDDEIDFFKQEGDVEIINKIKSTFLNENKLIKEDVLDKVIALSTKFAPPSKEKLLRDLMGEINSDPELKSAFQEFRNQDDFADERIAAGRYSAGDILIGMEDYLFRKQRN